MRIEKFWTILYTSIIAIPPMIVLNKMYKDSKELDKREKKSYAFKMYEPRRNLED